MWIKIKCSCGHYSDVQLLGKSADKERKKEFFETQGLCRDCYRQFKINQETAGCEVVTMDYRSQFKKYFDWCRKVYDSYNKETKTIDVYVPKDAMPFANALIKGSTEDQYESLVQMHLAESKHLNKIMEVLDEDYYSGLKDFIVAKHPEILNNSNKED